MRQAGRVFDAGRVYVLFGELLAALNYFSLAFCVMLYVKVGQRLPTPPVQAGSAVRWPRLTACSWVQGYAAPSSSDSGHVGQPRLRLLLG